MKHWLTKRSMTLLAFVPAAAAMALLPSMGTALAHEGHATAWEDGLEVFIEHPALVAGERARIAAHLTLLDGHRRVQDGTLSATLRAADGSERRAGVSGSSSGIFMIGLTPESAGGHDLDLILTRPERVHRVRISLNVYPRHEDVPDEHDDHDHDEDIVFTKEQQWLMPFATEPARREEIAPRLTAPAVVEAAPGSRAQPASPARGVLHPADGRAWPQAGQRLQRGEPLVALFPASGVQDVARLVSEVEVAHGHLTVAEAQLSRVTTLADEGVIADRRVLEAQAEASAARSAWRAASSRLAAVRGEADVEPILVRAPIDGVVLESTGAPGQVVEAGTPIATMIEDRRLVVRVRLLARDLDSIGDVEDLQVRRPDDRRWRRVEGARALNRGADPDTHGVFSLAYEVDNDGGWLPGLPLIASLPVERPFLRVTVPEGALLDDDGVAVLIVQHGGETFERRRVRTGVRAAGRIAVDEGLDEGERVVTLGAYAVLLAGRGPADDGHAHGHAH